MDSSNRSSKLGKESGKDRKAYWSGGHTKHRLLFHLVFTPKYRLRVLEGAIAIRLRELFMQACEMNGWKIHELGFRQMHKLCM